MGHYFHVVGEIEKYSAFMEQDLTASWTYPPLVSVPGVEPQKHMYGTGSSGVSFVLTTAAKDPAKILQWYDEVITSEDALLYKSLGIPGQDWTRTEDGKLQILRGLFAGQSHIVPRILLQNGARHPADERLG